MQLLLGIIIGSIFLILNGKILFHDIKNKKIPNKFLLYLLYLLPFWLAYSISYGYITDIHLLSSLFQILLSLFVTFLLFHFGIWGAGDAKYLLVLSLFILNIPIIAFIGCAAISILLYLIIYFIWFWTGRNIFTRNTNIYKTLWESKKDEIKEKYIHLSKAEAFKKIISGAALFIFIFIIERLLRLYVLKYLQDSYNIIPTEVIHYLLQSGSGIFILGIVIFVGIIGSFILIRIFTLKIQDKIGYNLQIVFISISLVFLYFLSYDDIIHHPEAMKQKIILVCTIYISIYFAVKLLWSSYKVTFHAQEEEYIHLERLDSGMVIDKKDLIKTFRSEEIHKNKEKNYIVKYIQEIKNPLDNEGVIKIKELYKIVDDHHKKKKTPGYSKMEMIKTIKVFALSPYIFLGFILVIMNVPGKISNLIISALFY